MSSYGAVVGKDGDDLKRAFILKGGRLPSSYCPENEVSIFSRLTFNWVTPIIRWGYRNIIEAKHLYKLPKEQSSTVLMRKFNTEWGEEMKKPHGKRSLLKAIWRMVWRTFACGGMLKLVHDCLLFLDPLALRTLLKLMETYSNGVISSSEMRLKGFGIALFLLCVNVLRSIILHQYFHRQFQVGIRVRSTFVNSVYEKTLRVSHVATKDGSQMGDVVNLVAVDAQRVQDSVTYLQVLWSGPFQICIALIALWRSVGWSAIGGIAFMLCSSQLTGFVATKVQGYQQEVMKWRDKRQAHTNELLSAIRILKMYAWETRFVETICEIRQTELAKLLQSKKAYVLTRVQWSSAPALVGLCTIGTYAALGNEVTAATLFTTISLLNILRFPLQMLPSMVNNAIAARVSLARVQKYLETAEVMALRDVGPNDEPKIEVKDCTLNWPDGSVLFERIHFEARRGITAVVGRTGCGKSGLLLSLVGDIDPIRGSIDLNGTIAFCSQTAWIRNCTVRDNITWGLDFDAEKYHNVLDGCALLPDLDVFPSGDMTEIGEKGINISGGQRQRIAIARAVYADADVYILDDVLSALDANVASMIFNKCIRQMLKDKVVILVTHSLAVLPNVEQIIFLANKTVACKGTYGSLMSLPEFAEYTAEATGMDDSIGLGDDDDAHAGDGYTSNTNSTVGLDEALDTIDEDTKRTLSKYLGDSEVYATCGDSAAEEVFMRRFTVNLLTAHARPVDKRKYQTMDAELLLNSGRLKKKSVTAPSAIQLAAPSGMHSATHRSSQNSKVISAMTNKDAAKLTTEEESKVGAVSWSVYKTYFKSCGSAFKLLVLVVLLTSSTVLLVATDRWLSYWSDHRDTIKASTGIAIYGGIICIQLITSATAQYNLVLRTQQSAENIHDSLIRNISRAPLWFYDITPLGRIVNRFTKDLISVDDTLPFIFSMYISTCLTVYATILLILFVLPWFICVAIPLLFLYKMIEKIFIASSRQLQRVSSVLRSPIIQHLTETLSGLSTIRATRCQTKFIDYIRERQDIEMQAYYLVVSGNRWLAIRLESMGCAISFSTICLTVAAHQHISPGLAGLAITYALQVTNALGWLVRMSSEQETNIVSVERLMEYSRDCPREALADIPATRPPTTWPMHGDIKLQNIELQYRPGLPLVLKGLTVHMLPGEKIGIVGRTGAGKSSILVGLLRLTELSGGQIVVDDIDLATIGLDSLRRKFCIIPQEPVLFAGTLRHNLDPFEGHTDADLWDALEKSHLKSFVESIPDRLGFEIDGKGDNLSMGQRQLVCVTRALLRDSRILLLDEATSAVDPTTDALIQQTIRTHFNNCTVLTIAHRLNTIIDYDKVLVMDMGRVAEFDSPSELMKTKRGIFRAMCIDAGVPVPQSRIVDSISPRSSCSDLQTQLDT
eukprot:Lankesteria_metandrocarpae@DN3045_c0_g1_i1.p1